MSAGCAAAAGDLNGNRRAIENGPVPAACAGPAHMAAQTRWRGRYAEKSEEMDPVRPVRTSVVPRSV